MATKKRRKRPHIVDIKWEDRKTRWLVLRYSDQSNKRLTKKQFDDLINLSAATRELERLARDREAFRTKWWPGQQIMVKPLHPRLVKAAALARTVKNLQANTVS